MASFCAVEHSLVSHHLAELRDTLTPPDRFRAAVRRLTWLLACEATRDLPTVPSVVRTPLSEAACARVRGRIAVVPILRAGLAMVDPVLEMVPQAEVRHLGAYRDESTLEPVSYYRKLPAANPADVAMIVDPMLATGGSAAWAIEAVRGWGVERVKLLTIIAAPEGIRHVQGLHPSVEIYVCAVDSHLDERGYIVPGLGDAGDRIFNTEQMG